MAVFSIVGLLPYQYSIFIFIFSVLALGCNITGGINDFDIQYMRNDKMPCFGP